MVINAYTEQCVGKSDVIPCFASDAGSTTWGHHDYEKPQIMSGSCHAVCSNGSVYSSRNMYIPKKGLKWQSWAWGLTQEGGRVPDNAIRYGDKVMARSTLNPPDRCNGKGFTGWASVDEAGTLGVMQYALQKSPEQSKTFEVAICKAYHPPTPAPTPEPTPAPTPAPVPTPLPSPTTWTGAAGNGDWFDAANWSPARVPGAGDVAAVAHGAATMDLSRRPEGMALDGLVVGGGASAPASVTVVGIASPLLAGPSSRCAHTALSASQQCQAPTLPACAPRATCGSTAAR